MPNHAHPASRFRSILIACTLFLVSSSVALAEDNVVYPNLKRVEGAKAALVEIDPNADFSVYRRVALLPTQVAFRSGWERSQTRTGSRIGVSQSDVDEIKTGVAELFEQVFTEVLEADDGYEVVEVAGDDVLLLRPAIIDLDISAPANTGTSLNTRTYTNETGSATLYIELFDSVSGQILGRAADRQTIRNAGDRFTWSTSASNRGDAQRMLRQWAEGLRNFLDRHYDGTP